MLIIEEYITLSKADRQKHIDLDDPCIERGGPQKGGLSSYCKGLMAHLLNTTIPTGHKIHVCHACNNQKCSNPKHLYWGTAQENRLDQGHNLSPWGRMVEKYGYEEARRINSESKKGNRNGLGNKNKPKTSDQRKKISDSIKLQWDKRKGLVA